MTDRQPPQAPKNSADDKKLQPDQGPKSGKITGTEVPDESKERHTEIAVEAGHTAGESHGDKN